MSGLLLWVACAHLVWFTFSWHVWHVYLLFPGHYHQVSNSILSTLTFIDIIFFSREFSYHFLTVLGGLSKNLSTKNYTLYSFVLYPQSKKPFRQFFLILFRPPFDFSKSDQFFHQDCKKAWELFEMKYTSIESVLNILYFDISFVENVLLVFL